MFQRQITPGTTHCQQCLPDPGHSIHRQKVHPLNTAGETLVPSLSFNKPNPNEALIICSSTFYFVFILGKKKIVKINNNVQEVYSTLLNCFLLLILT